MVRPVLFLAGLATATLSFGQRYAIPFDSPGGLIGFVQRCDAAGVRGMMSRGYDVKQRFEPPLLAVAAQKGCDDVAAALLEGGADPNQKDNDTRSAIIYAARDGRTKIAQMLLARGADPNARNDYPRVYITFENPSPHLYFDNQKTALMYAAEGGHTAIVDALVARGAKVNARAYYEETALMFAASQGRTATAVRLLELGADLHAAASDSRRKREAHAFGQSYGGTALLYAARGKHGETARALLERYGRHSIEDAKEVYYYSLFTGDVVLMEALAARGLDPPDDMALSAAAQQASPEVLAWVVDRRKRSGKPLPPSMLADAAQSGSLVKVKPMVDAGADVNARDSQGHSPLFYAVYKGSPDLVAYLLDHGARPNVAERSLGYSGMGETPLAMAVQKGDVASVKLLLAKGANPDFKGSEMSAREVAQQLGRTDMSLLFGGAAGTSLQGASTYREAGPVPFSTQARSGELLYATNCGCHGRDTTGYGATMRTMGTSMRIEGFPLRSIEREGAIHAVLFGVKRQGKIPMEEFASQLLDVEAAAILTYLEGKARGSTEAAFQAADIAAERKTPVARVQEPLVRNDAAARGALGELARMGYLYTESVFVEAVRVRDRRAIELFLAAGMSPSARNSIGHTALFVAISNDDTDAMKVLADHGAKFTMTNSPWVGGQPALSATVQNCRQRSSAEALRFMLDHGLDANYAYGAPGVVPRTLLMNAAGDGCLEAVKVLVARGADVNKRFPGGPTAYEMAKGYGGPAVMQVLLDAGAKH